MPPKFHYPDDVDVWQRLRWDLHAAQPRARISWKRWRGSPTATTFEQAQSAVRHAGAAAAERVRRAPTRAGATRLVPLLDEQLGYYRPALMVLFGAVGLLLVIGCLNVASLLLTRALSREREIAVRVAMGAAPRQLVTQLLAESLVLSVAGAVVGDRRGRGALPLIVAPDAGRRFRGSTKRALDLRALGARPGGRGRDHDVLRPGAGAAAAATDSSRPDLQVRRARQLARRAPHLLGARRRRGRARVRAARQLGAAGAHGRPDDADADRRRCRRRADDDRAAAGRRRIATWRVGRRRRTRRIIEQIRAAAGRRRGGRRQLPAARSRLARCRSASKASRRRRGPRTRRRRSITASATATSRRSARRSRRAAFSRRSTPPTRAGVVVVNETFAQRFLAGRRAVGRMLLTTRDRHRAARREPAAARPAADRRAPPPPPLPPTRFEIVGVVERHPQRAARPGGRAGDLFHHAAVSVPRAVPHGARDRPGDGAGGRAHGARRTRRRTCRSARRRRGASGSRGARRSRGC